jgi:hypothetical protein
MRERLAAAVATVRSTAVRARAWTVPRMKAAHVWTAPRAANAWRVAKAASISAFHACRRGLHAGLGVVERVLLSPSGRERTQATAVFALIFAFAVTSVDAIITGGMDFAPVVREANAATPRERLATTSLPAETLLSEQAAPVEIALADHVEGLTGDALLGATGALDVEDEPVLSAFTPISARVPARASAPAPSLAGVAPQQNATEAAAPAPRRKAKPS